MSVRREKIKSSLIANTIMQKIYVDEECRQCGITPNEGYVLHDKNLDYYTEFDAGGNGIGEIISGFCTGETTVRYDYDFDANPREFYAVLKTDTK